MWRFSLPIEKRSSYLGDQLSQVAQWAPRHKYLLFAAIISVLCAIAIALVAFQYAAMGSKQKENVSAGTRATTVVSDNQVVTDNQQTTLSAETNQPTPDNQASINSGSQTNSNTEVKVNNKTIPVPENGSVHTTVPTDNGSASVSINVDSNSSGSANSSSSSFVQVNSNSNQSQVTIEHSQ